MAYATAKTDVKQEVQTLIQALKDDPQFYEGYKANIAMAINDEFKLAIPNPIIRHELSNRAAVRFLKNWMINGGK